jgi:hypothetical protein
LRNHEFRFGLRTSITAHKQPLLNKTRSGEPLRVKFPVRKTFNASGFCADEARDRAAGSAYN